MTKEEYKDAIEVSVIFHEGQRMFAVPKQPAQQQEPTKAAELVDALIAKYSDKLYDSVGPHDAAKFEEDCKHLKQALAEQPAPVQPVSGFGLAAIGQKHFGNPIPKAWYAAARELMAGQPAQQEPAGSVYRYGKDSSGTPWHGIRWTASGLDLPDGTLIYTSPPAQRTWQGLTESEKSAALYDKDGMTLDYEDYAEAIEAKLRSKNEDRN